MIKLYAGFHISIKNLTSVFSIQTAGWMDEKMDRHTDKQTDGLREFTNLHARIGSISLQV